MFYFKPRSQIIIMSEEKDQTHCVDAPYKISFSGWKKIIIEVKNEIAADSVGIVSAGVAFYAFLAIFPAIMALISIYGLATDPQQIEQELSKLAAMMPKQAFSLLKDRVEIFLSTPGTTLGWGTAIGILFSIWSSNKGTKSLFEGIDIAYDTVESRGFFKQILMAIIFTIFGTILLLISLAFIVVFPTVMHKLGLPEGTENIIAFLRWIVLAVIVTLFLCLIYQYAPARKKPELKWVVTGAIFSTVVWLLASWGFSFYVSNYGNYGEVYGSISAVVILMLWLYITCYIILLGAEINSEIDDYVHPDSIADYKVEKKN